MRLTLLTLFTLFTRDGRGSIFLLRGGEGTQIHGGAELKIFHENVFASPKLAVERISFMRYTIINKLEKM